MSSDASEQKEITWTITVQGSAAQAETVQQLIKQFTSQVQAAGAKSNFVQVMQMAATAVAADRLGQIASMMRQQGLPEEQIEQQKSLIKAQMGEGSWADVVAATEQELAAHRAKGDVPQELGAAYRLVEYAMNMGDKEKAVDYFRQAEQLMAATDLGDLMGKAGTRIPPEAQEQTRQHYQHQLERLRNWLF